MAGILDNYDPYDDTTIKRGGGGLPPSYYGYTPGTPAVSGASSGMVGGGGNFFGTGTYDRTPPMYGYKRKPLGSIGLKPTTEALNAANTSLASAKAPTAMGLGGVLGGAIDAWNKYKSGGGAAAPATPPGATTGAYGAINPASNPLGAGFSADQTWKAIFSDLNNRMASGGLFDPMGSQATLDALAANMARQMGGRQQGVRTQLQSRLDSNPNDFALGSLMGDLGSAGSIADATAQAQLQSMFQNQDFLRSLFSTGLNADIGNATNVYNQTHQNTGGGVDWGSLLGSAAGSFLKGGI